MVGAARRAHGEMQRDTGEPGAGAVSGELGLDVALEHRAGQPAPGVAVIDGEHRFEKDVSARQDTLSTMPVSAPASSVLRLRSMPCETTV